MIKIIIISLFSYNLFYNIYQLYKSLSTYYKYKKKYVVEEILWFDEILEKYDIDEVGSIDYFENMHSENTLALNFNVKHIVKNKIIQGNMCIYVNFKDEFKTDTKELKEHLNEYLRYKKLKNKINKLKNNIKMK